MNLYNNILHHNTIALQKLQYTVNIFYLIIIPVDYLRQFFPFPETPLQLD
jgi:hypothetical protein